MARSKTATKINQRSFMFVMSSKGNSPSVKSKGSLGSDYRSSSYNEARQKLVQSLPNKKR